MAPPLTPIQQHNEECEPTYCAHTHTHTFCFTTQTQYKNDMYTHILCNTTLIHTNSSLLGQTTKKGQTLPFTQLAQRQWINKHTHYHTQD